MARARQENVLGRFPCRKLLFRSCHYLLKPMHASRQDRILWDETRLDPAVRFPARARYIIVTRVIMLPHIFYEG